MRLKLQGVISVISEKQTVGNRPLITRCFIDNAPTVRGALTVGNPPSGRGALTVGNASTAHGALTVGNAVTAVLLARVGLLRKREHSISTYRYHLSEQTSRHKS